MDPVLYDLLLTRLGSAPPKDRRAEDLILLACEGPQALEAALKGATAPAPGAGRDERRSVGGGVFLDSISVEGFRGVAPPATLHLSPFPGLTLVVGRNGSGKSSFAEALELLLTGRNRRWERRSEIWQGGWRNLHHEGATRVAADFIVEGRPGRTAVARRWEAGAALEEGTTTVSGATRDGTLDGLGWDRALTMYRPFLPHSELGALWDEGPTKLHDALAAILGLEDVATLIRVLTEARLSRERAEKEVSGALAGLRLELQSVDDDRARACLAATAGRRWDLPALAAIVEDGAAGAASAAQRDIALLRELSTVACPPAERVAGSVARLRDAAIQVVSVAGTDSGQARATAQLLIAALQHVTTHDQTTCPVCGTPDATGDAWRSSTLDEIERLTRLAGEAERVHRLEREERQLAVNLLGTVPAAVRRASEVGIDAAPLLEAWTAWLDIAADAGSEALAGHMAARHAALARATEAVREAAALELSRREDAWRPLAEQVRRWLIPAREAAAHGAAIASLREAEAWVKAAEKELRAERFAPVAAEVQRNWSTLRQDSSVGLDAMRLEGTRSSNVRRVVMDVSIDGAPGPALAVMSQGELNALALSMFLPRASLPESPFRFIVIDDPVQAMDPAKVEGLARVLEHAASGHQVVVFTHDERLPSTVRRLGIDASIVEVVRRERSVVELRQGLDPVHRHIEDAFAVARDEELPISAGRVVPTFCRLALEAACAEVVMRRRLAQGRSAADVERLLAGSQQLVVRLALALYDDSGETSRVATGVRNRWGDEAAGVVSRCNRGAHNEDRGDLPWLCTKTRWLAEEILKLP